MYANIQEHKEWYYNYQLYKHFFHNDGKLEGEYRKWFYGGHLNIHAFYKDGKLEGEYKSWYVDGQPSVHAFYKNGKLEGEYAEWYRYSDDHLLTHSFYQNGQLMFYLTSNRRKAWLKVKDCLRKKVRERQLAIFYRVLPNDLALEVIKQLYN